MSKIRPAVENVEGREKLKGLPDLEIVNEISRESAALTIDNLREESLS